MAFITALPLHIHPHPITAGLIDHRSLLFLARLSRLRLLHDPLLSSLLLRRRRRRRKASAATAATTTTCRITHIGNNLNLCAVVRPASWSPGLRSRQRSGGSSGARLIPTAWSEGMMPLGFISSSLSSPLVRPGPTDETSQTGSIFPCVHAVPRGLLFNTDSTDFEFTDLRVLKK